MLDTVHAGARAAAPRPPLSGLGRGITKLVGLHFEMLPQLLWYLTSRLCAWIVHFDQFGLVAKKGQMFAPVIESHAIDVVDEGFRRRALGQYQCMARGFM